MLKSNKSNLENLLGSLFTPKSPPVVGIDITGSSIKMVECEQKKRGKFILSGYSITPLPPDTIVDGTIKNIEVVTDAIKKGYKSLGTKAKHAVIAVPSGDISIKTLTFSSELEDHELEDPIKGEIPNLIAGSSMKSDDVLFDWQLIGPNALDPESNDVRVCIARREKAEERMASLETAGLKPYIVDVEQFAQQNAFSVAAKKIDDVIACVDAGRFVTDLNIIQDGQSLFHKTIMFGMQSLIESVASHYSLEIADAEKAVINNGKDLADFKENALDPFIYSFAQEINRAIQFAMTQGTIVNIDRCILAGGVATLHPAQVVQELIGIETLNFCLEDFIEVPSKFTKKDQFQRESPLLLTALGLAMRQFN